MLEMLHKNWTMIFLYNRWFTDSNGLKTFSKPQKLNFRVQLHYDMWIKDRDGIKRYKTVIYI